MKQTTPLVRRGLLTTAALALALGPLAAMAHGLFGVAGATVSRLPRYSDVLGISCRLNPGPAQRASSR